MGDTLTAPDSSSAAQLFKETLVIAAAFIIMDSSGLWTSWGAGLINRVPPQPVVFRQSYNVSLLPTHNPLLFMKVGFHCKSGICK